MRRCAAGNAVKPYRSIVDLAREETKRVRDGDWRFVPRRSSGTPPNREGQGENVVFCGGLFLIHRDTYFALGGFDERLLGWAAKTTR
jgi:GT2 family glycosyltransferase